jgi:predicted RNA binding protein YcfA (HicA-like mRNA interferase family)
MSGIAQISWKEFEKFLRFVGCTFIREKGDHRAWTRNGIKRPIIVPRNMSVPVFIIRNNLRLLNISVKEYLEIMGRV